MQQRREVDWFKAKRKILLELNPQDDALRHQLVEIKSIISGMGSITDLPLYPKVGVAYATKRNEPSVGFGRTTRAGD